MKHPSGAKVQSGAIGGAMHPRCKGAIPYIGNAPNAAPCSPSEVQHLRIILGARASEALAASGEECFVVIAKASWPDDPTRWALHLIPASIKAANAACEVAQGIKRAVKLRSRPQEPSQHQSPATAATEASEPILPRSTGPS
jgi:hypothetical protein